MIISRVILKNWRNFREVDVKLQERMFIIRESIVPLKNSTAKIGPDYNGKLSEFVTNYWNVEEAILASPSLARTYNKIIEFEPTF